VLTLLGRKTQPTRAIAEVVARRSGVLQIEPRQVGRERGRSIPLPEIEQRQGLVIAHAANCITLSHFGSL
jgi:hypothetical protein